MTNKQPATTTITIEGGKITTAEILNAQYAPLEGGEVRSALERFNGENNVWNDAEFAETFAVSYFDPPYVYVIRTADQRNGSVMYVNEPRFYFGFQENTGTPNDGRTP